MDTSIEQSKISESSIEDSNTTINISMKHQTIYHDDDHNSSIIVCDIKGRMNKLDNIEIEHDELFNSSITNIILGAHDSLKLQQIMLNSPPNKFGLNLISPTGTIIVKTLAGNPHLISNVEPNGEINRLSNIKFSEDNSVLILSSYSMSDFYKCRLPTTKKSFLLTDLNRMKSKYNTKSNVILVISEELLKIISNLDINMNDYFKLVINFPSNDLLNCFDEMINGKIIKSIDKKFEITLDIGSTNTILSSVFLPNTITSSIITHIGNNGRIRIISDYDSFDSKFIIIVKINEQIIFKCNTPETEIIVDNITDIKCPNDYLTIDNLSMIIQIAIDNEFNELIIQNKLHNDMLCNLMMNFIIRSSSLNSFVSLFSLNTDDSFITLIKQLISNIIQANSTMLSQLINTTNSNMIKFYDDKLVSRIPPYQRITHRYTSSPMIDTSNYESDDLFNY